MALRANREPRACSGPKELDSLVRSHVCWAELSAWAQPAVNAAGLSQGMSAVRIHQPGVSYLSCLCLAAWRRMTSTIALASFLQDLATSKKQSSFKIWEKNNPALVNNRKHNTITILFLWATLVRLVLEPCAQLWGW